MSNVLHINVSFVSLSFVVSFVVLLYTKSGENFSFKRDRINISLYLVDIFVHISQISLYRYLMIVTA